MVFAPGVLVHRSVGVTSALSVWSMGWLCMLWHSRFCKGTWCVPYGNLYEYYSKDIQEGVDWYSWSCLERSYVCINCRKGVSLGNRERTRLCPGYTSASPRCLFAKLCSICSESTPRCCYSLVGGKKQTTAANAHWTSGKCTLWRRPFSRHLTVKMSFRHFEFLWGVQLNVALVISCVRSHLVPGCVYIQLVIQRITFRPDTHRHLGWHLLVQIWITIYSSILFRWNWRSYTNPSIYVPNRIHKHDHRFDNSIPFWMKTFWMCELPPKMDMALFAALG